MLKRIIHNKWFYFAFIFFFMLLFNIYTFYIMDDYEYMMNLSIHNPVDLFSALKVFYFTWGGRTLAHFFSFSFLSLPKWIFNVVNSVVYTLNVYLVYLIVFSKKEKKYYYLFFIHILLFLFTPAFFQSFLWVDGSCNYSFPAFFQLLFLYYYLNYSNHSPFSLFLLGVLAGMGNENSSLSIIVLSFLYFLFHLKDWRKIIFPIIGLVSGYLFLFFAPGNFVRLTDSNTSFFTNFFPKLLYLVKISLPLLPFFILIMVVLNNNKKEQFLSFYFFLGLVVSIFSMVISPILNLRSFTFSFFYVLMIFLLLFKNVSKKWIMNSIVVLSCFFFTFITISTFQEYLHVHKFLKDREITIEEAKRNQETQVYLKTYKNSRNCRTPYSCELFDLSYDGNAFPNKYMALYYGVDRIIGY